MPFWLFPTLVTAVWGANTVLIKVLAEQIPPLHLAAYRMAFASLFLLPAGWLANRRARAGVAAAGPENILPTAEHRRTLVMAVVAGLCITVLHQIFLGFGMLWSKASIGSLILSLNPITTSLLAGRFAGEPLTWRRLCGAGLGFAGVVLAILDDRWRTAATLQLGLGEIFMFIAMLVYVIGNLIVRNAAGRESAAAFTVQMNLFGTILLVAIVAGDGLFRQGPLPMPVAPIWWWAIGVSGAFSNGLGLLLWNHSVQAWGAGRTSMFLNGLPISAMLVAALWLGESIRWPQLVGLAAVVAGVWLGTRVGPTEERPQMPAATSGRLGGGRSAVTPLSSDPPRDNERSALHPRKPSESGRPGATGRTQASTGPGSKRARRTRT